jgi:hypothetical protein
MSRHWRCSSYSRRPASAPLSPNCQRRQGRLAWGCSGGTGLEAERWSTVSDVGRGKVLYESKEVFSGPLAEYLKEQLAGALQTGFDAQGKALEALLEECDKD